MPIPRSERLPVRRIFSHLAVMAVVSVVLGVVVAGLAVPFAGLVGVSTRNVATSMNDLPAELKTPALPQRTTILDSQGHVIASLYDQNRINVPLKSISRIMVKALISIEDYRFYQHGAIDLKGTLRALITNEANGGVVQGGSTITQQLVKLTLVQNAKTKAEQKAATEDTPERKVRELRYAIALEQSHSKDWILERYLNTAYFGDGAFGVQAAARHYFNVNARDLSLTQAAVLAGLVKNPSGYDPTNFPDAAIARRDVVLDRMAQLNVISEERDAKAKQRALGLNVQHVGNGCVNSRAPFFCDYVQEYLLHDSQFGKTRQDRLNLLKNGGLTIKTTLSIPDQQAADQAVSSHVYAKDQAIGATAVVQPGTGNVLALAQSRPMGNDRAKGQTYINYAIPQEYGHSQCCQAGSTFKAFTLSAALEEGLPLTTTFDAQSPMTFDLDAFSTCPGDPGFGYGTFSVPNDTGTGVFNMYGGTRQSINTYYMQLEEKTGVCKPFQLAQAMGVQLTDPLGDSHGIGAELIPNFTLGVASASPLEMAGAYATFAARGLHCDTHPVTEVDDSAGTVLKQYQPACQQVIQQTTADAVNDVLRGVIEPGGFAQDQELPVPAAGKTGTTNNGNSVWFIGYTPHVATAVMLGGANQFGTPISLNGISVGGTVLYDAAGSKYAAPIWGDMMRVITAGNPPDNFVYPSTVPGAGVTSVPVIHHSGGGGGRPHHHHR